METVMIQCTVSSKEEARTISHALLEARVAACVSIAAGVESHYWWRGALEHADEALLVIKTTRDRFDDVRRVILQHHSYEVPEIIAVPIVAAHRPYLDWLAHSVSDEEAGI